MEIFKDNSMPDVLSVRIGLLLLIGEVPCVSLILTHCPRAGGDGKRHFGRSAGKVPLGTPAGRMKGRLSCARKDVPDGERFCSPHCSVPHAWRFRQIQHLRTAARLPPDTPISGQLALTRPNTRNIAQTARTLFRRRFTRAGTRSGMSTRTKWTPGTATGNQAATLAWGLWRGYLVSPG